MLASRHASRSYYYAGGHSMGRTAEALHAR